eukprot:scaffold28353_cov129-Isochrysis_galbana.AAC.2
MYASRYCQYAAQTVSTYTAPQRTSAPPQPRKVAKESTVPLRPPVIHCVTMAVTCGHGSSNGRSGGCGDSTCHGTVSGLCEEAGCMLPCME